MTLLIPLLLRLTALFDRGAPVEEPAADTPGRSDEVATRPQEKE